MRICRITSAFPPPWTGLAPGPYALSLAQHQRGADLTVLTCDVSGAKEVDLEIPFVVERIRAKFDVEFSFSAYKRFRELHRVRPFDIIHAHGFSGFGILLFKRFGFAKSPIVTSMHILRSKQLTNPRTFRDRWILFQERFVLENSDAICAVNNVMADEISRLRKHNSRQTFAVYNGVDVKQFRLLNAPEDGNHKVLKLLYVGVLNGRKGELDLLHACKLLNGPLPDWCLTIVGDGPELRVVQDFVSKNGLSGKVRLIQQIDHQHLLQIYNGTDVFVLPSSSEGMPKVLLEAMACGCPVVASDISGCRELVRDGKNGFLVPVNRPDLVAEAIMTFHKRPALIREMGAVSRKIVENEFTWDAVAKRVEQCYYSALKH